MKKIVFLLVMICFVGMQQASADFRELVTKEKRISKSYSVSASDKLYIINHFGDVKINTWNKNEISVDVVIEVRQRSENRANEMMDDISVDYSDAVRNGKITFKTSINRKNINNSNGERMRIDYTINMPKGSPIDIKNEFGNLIMDDFEGDMNIDVEYGNFNAGDITGSEKVVKVQFGKVDIHSIAVGRFNVEYSPLKIDNAQRIGLRNMFGKTTINYVQQLSLVQEYGNLELGTVNMLSGKISFAGININRVNKGLDLKLEYCNKSRFGTISTSANMLNVKSSFSNLYFTFEKGTNYNADIRVQYGAFDNDNDEMRRNIHRSDDNDNYERDRRYTGRTGNGSGTLTVTAEYGNINFD
ncbi:MAG: hypothetical protein JST82_05315 [Bacteroidetes bacterium]|nr:hypothetical protein [Bacteroidota bacterium]